MEQLNSKKFSFLKKENIPNFLTVARFCFLPVILALIFIPQSNIIIYSFTWLNASTNIDLHFFIAGLFFLLASITDYVDGYLARRFKWESDFGKIWDPISDKILVNATLISFAVLNLAPWFIVIIFIVRDTVVDAYRIGAASKKVVVAANIYGKLKTVFQLVGILLIFFVFNFTGNLYSVETMLIQNSIMFFATIMSIASGLVYIINIRKILKVS